MFQSILTLFSPVKSTRSYPYHPSMLVQLQSLRYRHPRSPRHLSDNLHSTDIISLLTTPLQSWILGMQQHLFNYNLRLKIFGGVLRHAHKYAGNQIIDISIHNLFVLVAQFGIFKEFLEVIGMQELEDLIDGCCGVYLSRKEEGTIDELGCLLHCLITNSCLNSQTSIKSLKSGSISKQFSLQNLPNFLSIFSNPTLQTILPSLLMCSELIKMVARSSNPEDLFAYLPWVSNLGKRSMKMLIANVDRIGAIGNLDGDIDDIAELTKISQNIDELRQVEGSVIGKKLIDKSMQLRQIQGFISLKALFSYGYNILNIPAIFRLQKQILDVFPQIPAAHFNEILNFIQLLLKACGQYGFNLQQKQISIVVQFLKASSQNDPGKMLEGVEPDIGADGFGKTIREMERYNWKHSKFIMDSLEEEEADEILKIFHFQAANSLLSHLLSLLFTLNLEYLPILQAILSHLPPSLQFPLQFHLLRQSFLHFCLMELHTFTTSDSEFMRCYFGVMAGLIKNNRWMVAVMDECLAREWRQKEQCTFINCVQKQFHLCKDMLISLFAVVMQINKEQPKQPYFPISIKLLCYHCDNPHATIPKAKHDVWILYIHEVIAKQIVQARLKYLPKQQLQTNKFFMENIESMILDERTHNLNEWITLSLILHADYLLRHPNVDLQELISIYLTTMITDALNWKYSPLETVGAMLVRFQQWEMFYTHVIVSNEENIDILMQKYGKGGGFNALRRWNRKITKIIQHFMDQFKEKDDF